MISDSSASLIVTHVPDNNWPWYSIIRSTLALVVSQIEIPGLQQTGRVGGI
jgi:hypothetical protein